MANSWLRLWHEMPNDPKWRSIARSSKQAISSVISVYVHLLVNASNATERGRTQNVCNEDIASALDLEVDQIDAIIIAMQGRVLDGELISGWSKRQVDREDGGAERARAWREKQKKDKIQTQQNATERNRTPDKDKDKDKDKDNKTYIPPLPDDLLQEWKLIRKKKKSGEVTERVFSGVEREAKKAGVSAERAVEICCEKGWASFDASWMPASVSKQDSLKRTGDLLTGRISKDEPFTIDMD